jgi:hypothetical protein
MNGFKTSPSFAAINGAIAAPRKQRKLYAADVVEG